MALKEKFYNHTPLHNKPNMKSIATTALLATTASAHAMFAHTEKIEGHDFTVSDLKSGNFTIASVSMVPAHSWLSWSSGTTAIVEVDGTTKKNILAGTFKWQLYETGVTSFIASGNSPYFTCDNKGCDPNSGIALKWKKTTGNPGDFTLSLTLALPKQAGSSSDFRLIIWGEDQDHSPYDFSATVDFSYATSENTVLMGKSKKNVLKAKQMQIHHAVLSGPDATQHCMEMTVQDPSSNEYWAAHGYQYPIQLWPKGPCDKKYNFFNRDSKIAAGVDMKEYGIHTSSKEEETRPAMTLKKQEAAVAVDVEAPDCSDNKCLFLVTNPSSPLGKQHCQELDNPNGTSGGYWKAKGWKYTSPPWTQGKCDRNRFNYVNRDTKNLDGFAGVEFWYLGIQV